MLKIGLTGGIGSGKSTISNMLKEKGFTIIDADVVAKEVIKMYPQIFEMVKEEFGEIFFNENGDLKRKEFGNFIFQKDERRKKYENIIMPFIKRELFNRIEQCGKVGKEICIIDAPTLIENGIHENMDINILVWNDLKTQIQRVKNRDNLTENQVLDRINSQMSLKDKKKFVDYIIDNSKTLEETKINLDRILKEINRKYRG